MGWTQMVNVIQPSTNATIFGCTSKVNGVQPHYEEPHVPPYTTTFLF